MSFLLEVHDTHKAWHVACNIDVFIDLEIHQRGVGDLWEPFLLLGDHHSQLSLLIFLIDFIFF